MGAEWDLIKRIDMKDRQLSDIRVKYIRTFTFFLQTCNRVRFDSTAAQKTIKPSLMNTLLRVSFAQCKYFIPIK